MHYYLYFIWLYYNNFVLKNFWFLGKKAKSKTQSQEFKSKESKSFESKTYLKANTIEISPRILPETCKDSKPNQNDYFQYVREVRAQSRADLSFWV